jgi:hypothetical protein
MRGTPRLLEATPSEGYAAHVRFEDGTAAEVRFARSSAMSSRLSPLKVQAAVLEDSRTIAATALGVRRTRRAEMYIYVR